MNFLAHLLLSGDDEGLRLGAMLGDFVRGNPDTHGIPETAVRGILLHRHIDRFIDSMPEMNHLRQQFRTPFRRYSGIIIDLAFDHELALHWSEYASISLSRFDLDVRDMLARNDAYLPETLRAFMCYADRRGLFAAYRDESEILFSLRGIGRRLSRANPLHRVSDIWTGVQPSLRHGFHSVFPQVQQAVAKWVEEAR